MAVTMTVGCQKIQQLVNPDKYQDNIDDDTPVLVTLGANVSATATTKAAVSELADLNQIYVYGLRTSATTLVNETETKDNKTLNTYLLGSNDEPKTITLGQDAKVPMTLQEYYGSNGEVYEFYGYYLGTTKQAPTAEKGEDGESFAKIVEGTETANTATVTVSEKTITVPITFDGQQDILVATTNKLEDIAKANTNVNSSQVYSAYSARRSVVPNLKFEHQLTQFTFAIENGTTLTDGQELYVNSLSVKSKSNANLTITNGSGYEFKASDDAQGKEFTYPVTYAATATENGDSYTYTAVPNKVCTFSVNTSTKELTESIMVMPGESSYAMTVYISQKNGDATTEVVPVSLDIKLSDNSIFKAGYSYKVTVKIYAQEAALLDVTIVDWKTGESIYIDNDDDDTTTELNATHLYAKRIYDDDNYSTSRMVYEVNVPESMANYSIQAALSTSTTEPTVDDSWVDLSDDTKSSATKYAIFSYDKFYAATEYYCHLRYKSSTNETNWTTNPNDLYSEVSVSPSFAIQESWLVNDWTSYNKLPQFYKTTYGNGISNDSWSQTAPKDLPWLAVTCTPLQNATISLKYKANESDGYTPVKTFSTWTKIPNGLVTICADEIGWDELKAGYYVVNINGVDSEAIQYPAGSTDSGSSNVSE